MFINPRLHVGHFHLHWRHNTTFYVAAILKQEHSTYRQGLALRQTRWNNVAEHSSNLSFRKMLQILEITEYTYNHLQLFPHNSSGDVELPLRVKNRRCSRGFN